MDFIRLIADDEVVFRISMNREDVHAADEALQAWLPLVSRLRPIGVEFTEADPSGLRHGFMGALMVARRLPGKASAPEEFEQLLREVLAELEAPELRLRFNEGEGLEARAEAPPGPQPGYGPHGVFVLFAALGYDPLNPEGGVMDYDDDEDL
ncbi:hypothetical protein [Streptomyces sp. NPDC016845]|uniref:hypothetical protein n=1 Tax=Streptomyces sp. NPDC016845 TaxID=3364972 RepID=UPI003795BD13